MITEIRLATGAAEVTIRNVFKIMREKESELFPQVNNINENTYNENT